MKQLFYTSCIEGRSMSGHSGFQIRAASRSLSPDEQQQVAAACIYELPDDVPADIPPERAPRRLALFDLPNLGRVLAHVCHARPDPETGRVGNYFVHAVVGTRGELDAGMAIRTWRSRFWETADRDGPTELRDVERRDLVPGAAFSESNVPALVAKHRRELEFLLRGLTAGSAEHLYLCTDPEAMAACVFGLTFLLPKAAAAELTFSTYESNPLARAARLVASYGGEGTSKDLDGQCYDGVGYGFNPRSGKVSPGLPVASEFVAFALEASIERPAELRQFLQRCEGLGITDGPGAALAHRLLMGRQPLGAGDLLLPAAQKLAPQLVKRPEFVKILAQAATTGSGIPAPARSVFLTAVKSEPAVLRNLIDTVRAQGLAAVRQGDLAAARAALEDLLPALAPGEQLGPLLLHSPLDASALALPIRLHFLPHVLAASGTAASTERGRSLDAVRAWLCVKPAELPELIGVLHDDEHRLCAVEMALEKTAPGQVPASLWPALAKNPSLALRALALVGQRSADAAEQAFAALLKAAPRQDWTALLLQRRPNSRQVLSPEISDRFLKAILATLGPKELKPWLVRHGAALRQELTNGTAVLELVRRILAEHPDHWSTDDTFEPFIRWVNSSGIKGRLAPDLQGQIEYQLGIKQFCERPSLDEQTLKAVAFALGNLPNGDDRALWKKLLGRGLPGRIFGWTALRTTELEKVLGIIANELLAAKEKVRSGLEASLAHLGPVVSGPNRWVPLFRDLFRRCSGDSRFRSNDRLLTAFVSVAAGEVDQTRLARMGDPEHAALVAEMENTVRALLRRQPKSAALAYLKQQLQTWRNREQAARWTHAVFGKRPDEPTMSWSVIFLVFLLGYFLGSTWGFATLLNWVLGK